MANIEIGGRLHSTATGNVVTGANEVLDDTKNKKQSVINAEVDETIGDDNTAGTIKGRIKTAEGKLDTLNGDSSTSGSVAKAVADAKTELIGGATSNGNTLKKVEDRTATLETAVGSNGSVDQRIAAAKSEVIGDAASDYNTLGKLEDKIQAEVSARQDAITAETNRATTRENQIYDLVHTPEQHYVTVATYADLANIASPSDDTVYRVSSYNGKTSQVDNTVYSEYGYDGTNFVFLCVKSQIDEVYDISAHHSNNTYVDLAAALDGGNNIPQELRRGGMSVKFVQSSDNKYVKFFCTADEFTTDTTQWAICDNSVLVECPEYVAVYTDADGKIIVAVENDGNIHFGAGVPKQVIDYIQQKIDELSLDEYEDIVAFLDDLEKGDKTLQNLLDEKVDKEEGKSLIDEEYASTKSIIENPEFIEVTTDSEDKVLEGTQVNGTKVIGGDLNVGGSANINGDIKVLGNMELSGVSYKVIENPEYLAAWVDAENKVIFGLKADGKTYVGDADFLNEIKNNQEAISEIRSILASISSTVESLDIEALSSITAVENPEYIKVELDAENKILSGTKEDGSHYAYNMRSETIDAKVDKEEGKSLIDEDVVESISYAENPEFINTVVDNNGHLLESHDKNGEKTNYTPTEFKENATFDKGVEVKDTLKIKNITTDGEGNFEIPKISIDGTNIECFDDPEGRIEVKIDKTTKVISYREADGTLVENVGLKTNSLKLTQEGMNELQQDLKDAGFQPGGAGNFSDEELVSIPFPVKASKINFIVARPITEECLNPYTGDDEQSGYLEYYDYYGNYFKKPCTINVQGQSSRRNRKKNISLDINDGSEIMFGDWVPQDSFHIKSHPNDITGTRLVSAYRFVEKIYQSIGGRPFDSINNDSSITYTNSTGNIYADYKSNVLCHPDGFAVEVYFNGEFWGLGMLQLKKHRKNYGMDKKDYESVLLDMNGTLQYFWGGKDTIGWTVQGMMDIKNPKKMIAMDGSEWEEGKELIDSTSPAYDATNKGHKNTAKTKKVIEDMADSYNEVLSLESELDDNAAAKAKFEELYDKDACEAVYIVNCVLNNADSIQKNTLWMKYKNGKIAPAPYDLDGIFGSGVEGVGASSPSAALWDGNYATSAWPLSFVWKYYSDEIIQKYSELRRNKVISVDTFEKLFDELYNQQSFSSIEREIQKWTPAPYRDEGTLNSTYWRKGSYGSQSTWKRWDKDTEYQVNDCVFVIGDSNVNAEAISGERQYGVKYTAIAPNQNQCPVDIIYDNFPYTGGMYDSIKRQVKWIGQQIRLCDLKLGYSE